MISFLNLFRLVFCLLVACIQRAVVLGFHPPSSSTWNLGNTKIWDPCHPQQNTFVVSILCLQNSSEDESAYNSNDNIEAESPSTSENEFSRIIRPRNIFHHRKHQSRQRQSSRDYTLTITAKPEECQALADRFQLTQLAHLEATLQVRPAISMAFDDANAVILPLEVEGTIASHLTQTCVRTNEQFEADVEFPIYALVKPMSMEALMKGDGMAYYNMNADEDSTSSSHNKKKNNKKKKKQKRAKLAQSSRQVHSLQDVFDLQAAIEASEAMESNDGGISRVDESAALVEDESIYSSETGILDIGELVAQTFWLQLDPYPKKPGTGPIELEISG